MGDDEYHPISRKGSNLTEAGGIGYTVIDSIDTMLLMGLDSEYQRARSWVADKLSFERDGNFNTFEVRCFLFDFRHISSWCRQLFEFLVDSSPHMSYQMVTPYSWKRRSFWQTACFPCSTPHPVYLSPWSTWPREKGSQTKTTVVSSALQKSPRSNSSLNT